MSRSRGILLRRSGRLGLKRLEGREEGFEGERVIPLRVILCLFSCFFGVFFTGNAGGGAQRRPAGATGGPGDVHTANRGPAGRPGGSGVQRRKRHGEVRELA